MTLHDVFKIYDEGQLDGQSEDQLRWFHRICANTLPNDRHTDQKKELVAARIETLLQAHHAKKLHIELVEAQKKLQAETEQIHHGITRLKKPHWTMTPAFWVGVGTLIFAAIAAWACDS
jgi:hypothetical protein